ncbi:MarR family winged helix-turn-helix transcriptional regulator [Streptomyces xiamenensis]|uniref:MarR family winged helix-turn-helix transcriptional regulator n=1 Tax=Streptomyces xiamenensis TaxID=408015 RepID=UPI00368FA22D
MAQSRERFEGLQRELLLLTRYELSSRQRDGGAALERSAHLLLTRLAAQGPMTIAELAQAFALDTSTINRQTAALLREGLARRVPDPDGGMARRLQMTEEGARRLADREQRSREGLAAVLAAWDPEDVQALEESLTRFNQSIEARTGRSWPRPAGGGPAGADGTPENGAG